MIQKLNITKNILIRDESDQNLVRVAPEGIAGAGKTLPGPLSKRIAVEASLAAVARRARVPLAALEAINKRCLQAFQLFWD